MSIPKAHNRSLLIFYLLVGYVVLQFSWWAFHIISLAEQVSPNGDFVRRKILMISGEAIVFFMVLFVGVYFVRKAFKKELELTKEKKNFILSVTHELKTPIASSKLFTETLLSREIDKEKQNDILQKILKDQVRLEKLVENILLTSKMESNQLKLSIEAVNCKEFVQSVVSGLENGNNCKFDISEDILINIDRFYFTSVIQNLHENAVKYSNDSSKIIWKAFKKGSTTVIQVVDEGVGIPVEMRQKVFELFHRVGDENTRQTKGTGVGLYIVNRIIILHRGTITVKSNQPKGSIFEIELLQ